jgi:hypothetical protein
VPLSIENLSLPFFFCIAQSLLVITSVLLLELPRETKVLRWINGQFAERKKWPLRRVTVTVKEISSKDLRKHLWKCITVLLIQVSSLSHRSISSHLPVVTTEELQSL